MPPIRLLGMAARESVDVGAHIHSLGEEASMDTIMCSAAVLVGLDESMDTYSPS